MIGWPSYELNKSHKIAFYKVLIGFGNIFRGIYLFISVISFYSSSLKLSSHELTLLSFILEQKLAKSIVLKGWNQRSHLKYHISFSVTFTFNYECFQKNKISQVGEILDSSQVREQIISNILQSELSHLILILDLSPECFL